MNTSDECNLMTIAYLYTSKGYLMYRWLLVILLILGENATYALQSHTKWWSGMTVTQSFSDRSPWKYYIEPQLRLIDDNYKFNQLLLLAGAGYQVTPSLILLAGPGWILSREVNGQWRHEQRLWQQLGWNITDQINSRTRLEERRDTSQPGIAWRFRERLWLRHPIAEWSSHSLSLFDEMLFNVNHPDWVSSSTLAQNRAFIGIGTDLSSNTVFDIGYLNQYIWGTPNQMDHVLFMSLTVSA